MRSRWRCLAAGSLLLFLGSSAPAQTPGEEPIRLADPDRFLEERVIIPLRVWDNRDNRFVAAPRWLRPDRFYIREDSVPQITRAVDQETRPYSIALAVDTSASMKESLPAVRRAGRRLFDRLKPTDQISLLSFNHDVVVRTDLTNNRRELNRGLAGLHADGFTSLYDSIDTALDLLEHRPDPRAIVVLTDGADNRSTRFQEEVLKRAYEARIPLFFIYHKVQPAGFRHLTDAADHTGGRVFQAEGDEDLARIFGTIAEGLRRTILVAYRSSLSPEDKHWRELEVRHEFRRFQIHTWKKGYSPEPPVVISPLMGLNVPLHLPPPSETQVQEPLPRHICPPGFTGPLPEYCPGDLTVRLTPDNPTRLEIIGWIGMGHDLGPMLHPARYGDDSPLPDDPRNGVFQDWRFHREYGSAESMNLALPVPEMLPRDTDALWDQLLTSGATFRAMGMEESGPAELTTILPKVPGYAATSRNKAPPALDLWWPNGGIVSKLRESFISWVFQMSPDYRLWVRDRYEEATSDSIRREYEAALRRLPQPVPDPVRDRLARYVESNVRSTRRLEWNRIQDGELLPSAHLFVTRRDIPAATWFDDGDRILLSRLLESPTVQPADLDREWLSPARRTWSRLRSFLAPVSHRSLAIGLPFQDRESGEIYLQRLLMPWCDADERPDCIQFPPPRPEGLELVAELLQRPDVGSEIGNGSFRCIGRCVHTATDYSSDPDSMPPGRRIAWQAVRRERDRLRAIRLELGAVDGAWLYREEKYLKDALEAMENLTVSVAVRLGHTSGDGTGLLLRRINGGQPWARGLNPVDMVLEVEDLSSATDLPDLVREHGFDPDSKQNAAALLATRINRTTLPNLVHLVGDGEAALCRPGEDFARIRLLFHADIIEDLYPARIRMWQDDRVLVMNLVAGPLNRLRTALEEACAPPEPDSAP